jgi:hypothetical protein
MFCNALNHGHYQNWDASTLPSMSSYFGNAHGLRHITLHFFNFDFQMVIIYLSTLLRVGA